jgi:hypothetical protein
VELHNVVGTIAANATNLIFAGPTATVVPATFSRLTGSAILPLHISFGSPVLVDFAMCYSGSDGVIKPSAGSGTEQTSVVSTTAPVFAASASVIVLPGTYTTGFCVRNTSATAIRCDRGGGFVQVTNDN